MSISPVPVDRVEHQPENDALTARLTLLFAIAVGVIATNVFAPQTLVGVIGSSLGLSEAAGGLAAMATMLGYSAGLFLLVPLADLIENRALVLRMLAAAITAAALTTLMTSFWALLVVLFVLGAACSAVQMLVPIAVSMAAPARRGRAVGDVMSGLMIGILLARPIASFLADGFGWRAFYVFSAIAMMMLAGALAISLPRRRSSVVSNYGSLLGSLWHLLRDEPVLRRRALTASLAMAAFSLFWTAVALLLTQAPFDFTQRRVAVFALVGAAGAVVAPLAGRVGDRGWTRPASIASSMATIGAFALAAGAAHWSVSWPATSLIALGLSAILLDVGVTGDQTLGRRAINLLRPEARGRINGLFVGLFFLGGGVGSAGAGAAWVIGGWGLICGLGAAVGVAALIIHWRDAASCR